jgi:hypothetical protein
VRVRVHCVLTMTHVVSGVVNMQDINRIDVVVDYTNHVSVFIREFYVFTIETLSQESAKKVVFQFWNEIL